VNWSRPHVHVHANDPRAAALIVSFYWAVSTVETDTNSLHSMTEKGAEEKGRFEGSVGRTIGMYHCSY